jgi:hypothetical protein
MNQVAALFPLKRATDSAILMKAYHPRPVTGKPRAAAAPLLGAIPWP